MKTYLRILGCLSLLTFVAWRLDWSRFGAAFARLDLTLWFGALVLFVGAQVVSSVRWKLLAGALGFSGSTLRYVGYYFIGMFFNLALPSSVGGDVARAWYLADQEGGATKPRRLEAFLSVFSERLSGILMLAALACVAALCCPVPLPGWVIVSVALVGAGALGGTILLMLIPAREAGGEGILARLSSVSAAYRSKPRLLMLTFVLSIVVQAASVALVAIIGAALDLSVPPLYWAVIVPLVSLLTLLPISINGMGLREMGFILLLKPLGIETAAAVGLSLLTFAATSLPALGGAGVMLFGRFPRLAAQKGGVSVEVRSDDEPVRGDSDQGRARQSSAAA